MTDPRLDTFDLLGVSGREDSYTDLLFNAFNQDADFQRWFLGFVGERSRVGWRAESRIRVKRLDSSRADVPDIVLTNASTKKLIVVEVKVWSGEGEDQLQRYSERAFQEELSKQMLGVPNFVSCSLIYLTLDPYEQVTQGDFKWMTFDELQLRVLARMRFGSSRLHRLLKELSDRIAARKSWVPDPKKSLESMFEGGPKLLSSRERLDRFVRDLVGIEDLEIASGMTNNPQHGSTPLVQLRQSGWSIQPNPGSQFAGSRDLHFELQWLGEDGLSAEIHYETNPYSGRRAVSAEPDEFEQFRSEQTAFLEKFFAADPLLWKRVRRRGWVSVAVLDHGLTGEDSFWLPATLPAGKAAELIASAIDSARRTFEALVSPT